MSMTVSIARWIDQNIEKSVILVSYVAMAGIVFVEVFRRFVLKEQAPWSTTIPIYMFLFVTWVGAAYNAKIRTHLSFTELRTRLPYKAQFACLILDAVLWVLFGVIVAYYAAEQVYIAYDNFSIVQGTNHLQQWWFYMVIPLSWGLLIVRVLQNLFQDYKNYQSGEPLIVQTSMLGE